MKLDLFLSAPCDMRLYRRSVVAADAYRGFQHLLGFDAQLRLFADRAHGAGCATFFLPAPEIFFAEPIRDLLRTTAERGPEPGPQLHLRFGMLAAARVCKVMPNIAVVAELAARPPVNLGVHPFAAGDCLPAAFDRAFVYEADLPAIRTIAGAAVVPVCLPSAFTADAASSNGGVSSGDAAEFAALCAAGLQVQSFAEYEAAEWSSPADADFAPAWLSADFGRALSDRSGSGGSASGNLPGGAASLILVPWNLSDPRSMIPDLIAKLGRFGGSLGGACRPVFFPYNATPAVLAEIGRAIGLAKAEAGPAASWLGNLFVARLIRAEQGAMLSAIFDMAWLDGNDAEHRWNLQRLGALGILSALLADSADPPTSGTTLFRIEFDETREVRLHDNLGPRLFRSGTLSPRRLAELIGRSLQHAAARARDGWPPATAGSKTAADKAAKRDVAALFAGLAGPPAPAPARRKSARRHA